MVTDELKAEFVKAKDALMGADKICIISHRSPDADAVGSNLALRPALEAFGKTVTSASVDKVPEDSMFLPKANQFVQDFNYEDFDAIVSVDCGALKLVQFHQKKPELLSGRKPFINFDHHGSNDFFGTINAVDPEACATAFILYEFFEFCDWKVTIDIANCLLAGIYFDTGGMMHSNTTHEVFLMAEQLMRKGADVKKISKELFHTTSVNKLRLLGRIFERTYVNEEGVAVSVVNKADFEACGVESGSAGGAIDYLNAVPGAKYCVLLSEGENGIVKGSLRTQREDVDLSLVAAQWGGGGHAKASGFGVTGHLKQVVRWKVETDGEEKGGAGSAGSDVKEVKF